MKKLILTSYVGNVWCSYCKGYVGNVWDKVQKALSKIWLNLIICIFMTYSYFFRIMSYLKYYINFNTYFFYSYDFDIFIYSYHIHIFVSYSYYFLCRIEFFIISCSYHVVVSCLVLPIFFFLAIILPGLDMIWMHCRHIVFGNKNWTMLVSTKPSISDPLMCAPKSSITEISYMFR